MPQPRVADNRALIRAKRLGKAISAVALAAAGAMVWFSLPRHTDIAKALPPAISKTTAESSSVIASTGSSSSHAAPAPHATPAASNFANQYRRSHNYLEFARAAIASARAGDPDAQYYLGKALRVCEQSKQLFRFNSQEISVEQAMARYSWGHKSAARIAGIYDRCHALNAVPDRVEQFGDSGDWIQKASDQNQPVAQTDEAMQMFEAALKSNLSGTETSNREAADPRALIAAAVTTKDPEALVNIGDMQGFLSNPKDDALKNELAWWLVACQRGLDCGNGSEFQRNVAIDDALSDLSGPDLICALAAEDCQEVERRAFNINRQLDAEAWDKLGW